MSSVSHCLTIYLIKHEISWGGRVVINDKEEECVNYATLTVSRIVYKESMSCCVILKRCFTAVEAVINQIYHLVNRAFRCWWQPSSDGYIISKSLEWSQVFLFFICTSKAFMLSITWNELFFCQELQKQFCTERNKGKPSHAINNYYSSQLNITNCKYIILSIELHYRQFVAPHVTLASLLEVIMYVNSTIKDRSRANSNMFSVQYNSVVMPLIRKTKTFQYFINVTHNYQRGFI